jgi:hypothetical protein
MTADKKNPYEDLRKMALEISRNKAGLPAPDNPNDCWGAIMDWGIEKGAVTVVAYSNGAASIYFSTGGGFIGGEQHSTVREAAKKMVTAAIECQQYGQPEKDRSLPAQDKIRFYFLTDAGVLAANDSVEALSTKKSPMGMLGDAVQNLITQYRLIGDGP